MPKKYATAILLSLMAASAATGQNIILILTDDQGWSQLSAPMDPKIGSSRSTYLETPNMKTLMQEGMRFTSGYSPAPLCTPTRRSILCGTSAARSGPEFKSDWVPAKHLTIPRALKQVNAGYRCAHFGKWGEQMISTPEECGYDASDGMTGNATGGMPKSLGIESGNHDEGPPHFIDNQDPKLTASVTGRAIDFMRQQDAAERPFYVQISYYAQHLSVVTRDKTLAKYMEKGIPDRGYTHAWAAMMQELDDGVGQVIAAVKELQTADQTYIFFTSDNGGRGTIPGGDSSRTAPNAPLTGAKHSLYEGGIRVPFFALGPEIAAGSVCRHPVVGYDFLPTFVEIAGGDATKLSDEVDGSSFRVLLGKPDGESIPRPAKGLVFHRPARLFSAYRDADFKLMLHWQRNGQVARRELFRMTSDPVEEGKSITATNIDKADEMQSRLLAYLKSIDADTPPTAKRTKRRNPKGKKAGGDASENR